MVYIVYFVREFHLHSRFFYDIIFPVYGSSLRVNKIKKQTFMEESVMRKFAVGVIVGVMTLMFGSVSAFAITPADEAEAKYQAEKEAAEMAKLVADAAEKEETGDVVVIGVAEKEEAEEEYVKAQAEYYAAKEEAERAATEAMALEKEAREAEAAAAIAIDKSNGLYNKVDSYIADENKAYSKYEYAVVINKSNSEIDKLWDEYKALADKTDALIEEQKDAADYADDLIKVCNDAFDDYNAAADRAADWAAEAEAWLAVF